MQLIKDGPNIPPELFQKLEDGKLIFFCGAGISYPVGLPGFKGLVEKVYEELHMDMEPDEKQAFTTCNYDRTLGLLENRVADSLVRKAIIKSLTIDPASKKLATYSALLALARVGDEGCRLVTTNFDRGFILSEKSSLVVDSAPKLGGFQDSCHCFVHAV